MEKRTHIEFRTPEAREFIDLCRETGWSASKLIHEWIVDELRDRVYTSVPVPKRDYQRIRDAAAERSRLRNERRDRVLKRAIAGDTYTNIAVSEGLTVSGVSRIVERNYRDA